MYRVGIDLGGTNIKVGIVNETHGILIESSVPTYIERDAELIIRDMGLLALQLLKEKNIKLEQVSGIGIGSPGAIDRSNGIVLYSNNFRWENVPLAKMIHKYIDLPVFIANDAQCAALGEVKAGAGRNCHSIIMITLGTGVGGGIIINGEIFEGGHSGGGVIGHMMLVKDGEECTCGRKGCFEVYASASALIRNSRKAVFEHSDSIIFELCEGDISKISGKTPFDAADKQDPIAQKIVDDYINYLGEGIVNLVDIFRPEKILLSGGICNQGTRLTDPLNDHLRKTCFAKDKLFIPKVERAVLGNSAGIIGAASLVLK